MPPTSSRADGCGQAAEVVVVDRRGDVVVWTIDRPLAKNALDYATFRALHDAMRIAGDDSTVRAAILTGAGGTFVSGGDLRELRARTTPEDAAEFSDLGWTVCKGLGELPFPVLCALTGPAIGGGAELAMACDVRIADPTARIAFKQVRMGVTTAWGTAARLVSVVGSAAAARLLLTAHEVAAGEALRLGLVDEVTEDGQAVAVALGWAEEVAKGSPSAVRAMKHLVQQASHRDVRPLERALFVETWSAPDHVEAVEAYFERRPPRWLPR